MARATRSVQKRARHKKWLKRAKGYRGRRHTTFKLAKEAVLKAGQHAYHDRRKKKATFRQQWQGVISAAVRPHDLSYSRFMHMLKARNIELNRKALAEIAKTQPEIFKEIISQAKK